MNDQKQVVQLTQPKQASAFSLVPQSLNEAMELAKIMADSGSSGKVDAARNAADSVTLEIIDRVRADLLINMAPKLSDCDRSGRCPTLEIATPLPDGTTMTVTYSHECRPGRSADLLSPCGSRLACKGGTKPALRRTSSKRPGAVQYFSGKDRLVQSVAVCFKRDAANVQLNIEAELPVTDGSSRTLARSRIVQVQGHLGKNVTMLPTAIP